MATLSQAVQECTEGATTRLRSPDRTVKAHERAALAKVSDEIVWAAHKKNVQKQGIKSLCDNTTAGQVWALDRDTTLGGSGSQEAQLYVLKNKTGPQGRATLTWVGKFGSYESAALH